MRRRYKGRETPIPKLYQKLRRRPPTPEIGSQSRRATELRHAPYVIYVHVLRRPSNALVAPNCAKNLSCFRGQANEDRHDEKITLGRTRPRAWHLSCTVRAWAFETLNLD